jgi:UDP:flavonoid glycosyltransferase YjiC (YdhE family)
MFAACDEAVAVSGRAPDYLFGQSAGETERLRLHDLADLASDQVTVAGVLPSHLVMGDVDLAVIAGGQGSVQTALAAGIPFVGIPLQSEQDANVTFAQNQGAARLIAQKAAGTPAMTAAARDLLTNPAARNSARRLQQIFAAVDGPAAAAHAVLETAAAQALRA